MELLQRPRHEDRVVVKTDPGNKQAKENHRGHQRDQSDSRGADRLQFQILGHPSKDDQGGHENPPGHGESQRLRHQQGDHLENERDRHLVVDQQLEDLLEGVAEHDHQGKDRHRSRGGGHHLAGDMAVKDRHGFCCRREYSSLSFQVLGCPTFRPRHS